MIQKKPEIAVLVIRALREMGIGAVAVCCLDQLHGDPHPVSGEQDCAFHYCIRIQLPADLRSTDYQKTI